MSYYIRKITRAKWPDHRQPVISVEADAISELRTQKNSLSVWFIDSIDEVNNAVLALATSSLIKKIENIFIVILSRQQLDDANLAIDEGEKGNTAIESLVQTHRNICRLNYESIGTVTSIIMDSLDDKRAKRVSASELKIMLKNAYSKGIINMNLLHDDLKDKIMSL